VKFTFSTGYVAGHEAAPLVVNNTMYIVTPWPNVLYALDLTQPGAPVKWSYEPKPLSAARGVACCDVVNRGAAYANGTVFYNTLDNRTVAIHAETGQERWTTTLGDVNRGETMTMAPLVVKDKARVRNPSSTNAIRTASHARASICHRRAACCTVNRRPGISWYSPRIRRTSGVCGVGCAGTVVCSGNPLSSR
jgi:glucose dehydrogenase